MRWPIKFTKYNFNKVVFFSAQAVLWANFYLVLNFDISIFVKLLIGIINVFCLHYNLNVLHQAAHGMLSRNRLLNSIFGNLSATLGGITFADFKSTHQIHHKNPSDPEKDPDYNITASTNFFFLPFKIWYHDRFYWQNGLWKLNAPRWMYFSNRIAQILIVLGFQLTGHISSWIYFWLIPTYLVGFLNGLFLFYFPHYTTKLERVWREQLQQFSSGNLGDKIFRSIGVFCIDVSRYYHEKHHLQIQQNQNFYPLEDYLLKKLLLRVSPDLDYTGKYLDIYGKLEN